jgi:hypothetical protein
MEKALALDGWWVREIAVGVGVELRLAASRDPSAPTASVKLLGAIEIGSGGREHIVDTERQRAALGPIFDLVHATVQMVAIDEERTIVTLLFDREPSLRGLPDDQYECWEVRVPGHLYIGQPGGGVAIWDFENEPDQAGGEAGAST